MSLKKTGLSGKQDVVVPNPVDLILVAHTAFRRDLSSIDAAALAAARQLGDISETIERLEFFSAMLAWHAQGEDDGIFPALERVAPDVAASYELDHRGLDLASDGLNRALAAGDALEVARAAAAFKFHLDMHLHKEEVHLYRLFVDRLPEEEQAEAVGIFTDALPGERFGDFVRWLFPLVDNADRARVVRVWQAAMPEAVFAGTLGLVQRVLGEEYRDLAARVPAMSSVAASALVEEQDPSVVIPTGEEPVRFESHIKPLFRTQDQRSMSFAFDLWSYDQVRDHADGILDRLRSGSMPCDGAWPDERIEVFARWVASGMEA